MSFFYSLLHKKLGQASLFWGLVILRAVFNYYLPLMDKTEARYAEIARIMAETGNWVVPQIDYAVPFWAKPPLSTWASALSISLFGTQEFFVRLPYLLLAVGMGLFLSRYKNKQAFYFPGILLLCLPEFYLHAGVVSTDLFLAFSIGLMMLSFWEALQKEGKRLWGFLFFVGLGLGLLAKGPIVAILTLPPIGLWCLLTGNLKRALTTAPWVAGILLSVLISVPWYWLAEMRSPGFIDYFIVGEHFERYFNAEWQGDKYGFPKQQPYGIVWLFFGVFILPWSILLIRLLLKKWKVIRQDSYALFLLIWMLWTPIFFTASTSLIHPYILPSMIPVALLINHYWEEVKNKKNYLNVGIGIPLLLLFLLLSGLAQPLYKNNTDKYILENLDTEIPIYSLDQKSYSSQFYTQGRIQTINESDLEQLIQRKSVAYIRIAHKRWKSLSENLKSKLKERNRNRKAGIYSLREKTEL